MTNAKNTEEVSGGCGNVSYIEFMGSGLAELTIENLVEDISKDLLATISSKDAAAVLAAALRDYVDCANARIRVRGRTKEFDTSCLRVVDKAYLEVLDNAQLERYVLPLMLRPDFRIFQKPIK
jgi:hypothetical protein